MTIRLLALDTCTEACSAALLVGDAVIERYEVMPRGHSARILSMIDELLAEAGLNVRDLSALAFGRGPGSFTGVRIGAGVTQGIAYAADLPVAAVSTLAMLAEGARREASATAVLSAIDARMGEVYWGVYRRGSDDTMQLVGQEAVAAPGSVVVPAGDDWFAVGTGWNTYREELEIRCEGRLQGTDVHALPRARDALPTASAMLRNGELVAAERAVPVYLRNRVTG